MSDVLTSIALGHPVAATGVMLDDDHVSFALDYDIPSDGLPVIIHERFMLAGDSTELSGTATGTYTMVETCSLDFTVTSAAPRS